LETANLFKQVGGADMQHESNQANVMDFAELWRYAEHHRTDDVAPDIDILKTIAVFCGVGLLLSLLLAAGPSHLPIEPQTLDVINWM
jgi:hypothetical protein